MTRKEMEQILQNYMAKGNMQDIIKFFRECEGKKYFKLAEEVGKYFMTYFPSNPELILAVATCALECQDYPTAYDLCDAVLKLNGIPVELANNALGVQARTIPFVKDRYTRYNPEKVREIQGRTEKHPLVTLSITTCKRFDLFEKTMNSFLNCCLDLHLIGRWICVDDNSSEEDRQKMRENYPFFEFVMKTPEQKGHPQSMNIIRNMIKSPYLFHMEDDWQFICPRRYITDCLDVLSQGDKLGQCLINRNYAETERDFRLVGGHGLTSISGLRFMVHEHTKNDTEQQEFYKKYGGGFNCSYWPHFSFRPGLNKTFIWKDLGPFNELISHFEMDFSYKYRDNGYLTAFLENIQAIHIGRLPSERNDQTKKNAYILNGEAQFSGKEQQTRKIRTYIVNLDRRPDRWAAVDKNPDLKFLDYTRFSAVDGSKIVPTEALQRIFDGNDYNMREGMVGCALSHIKLWTELAYAKNEMFCILEDDLELVPGFKEKFDHVTSILPTGWDICFLGHHIWKQHRKPEYYDREAMPGLEKWDTATSMKISMGGTGGYLISKKGAMKMLEFINRVGMTNGIDTMMQKAADTLDVYYCKPHLIYSDCWTPESSPDTDIQHNFKSLTIPVNNRLRKEIEKYTTQEREVILVDYDEAERVIVDPELTQVLVHHGPRVRELLQKCIHPCYTLNYQTFIAVPVVKGKPLEQCQRLARVDEKGNIVFNIDDVLVYKNPPAIISFSDMKHVSEAAKTLSPNNPEFPFDTADGVTIPFCIDFSRKILALKPEEVSGFVADFFNPTRNGNKITYIQYSKKNILENREYNVRFPHEDLSELGKVYMERINNYRKVMLGRERAVVVFCVRYVHPTDEAELNGLVQYMGEVNPNARILSINAGGTNGPVLSVATIDFPEKLRVDGWPAEKVEYDQKVFRTAIPNIIQNVLF